MKDHKIIYSATKKLIEITKNLEKNLQRTDVGYSEHRDYFDWINSQINILEDCLFLLENGKSYATIFPALRVVFENYWIIALSLNGDKYYKYFRIKEGEDINKIYKSWLKEFQKLKQRNSKINILSVNRTKKKIVVCYRGFFDKEECLIPKYYWLLKEYHPTKVYLGRERRLIENYLVPPQLANKFVQGQKDMKSDYFDFENGISQHLILNSMITNKQLQRFKIHYNFLSQWIHPTEYSLKISSTEYFPSLHEDRSKMNNFYTDRLILLYIGNLTKMFLEAFLVFLDRQIKEKKLMGINNRKEIELAISTFNQNSEYFWFIFNKPHFFYKYNYCINRMWRGTVVKREIKYIDPNKLPNHLIPYYSDPLGILEKASGSFTNAICGQYISPIKKEN